METDLEIIKQIENNYGIQISQETSLTGSSTSYVIENNKITGLSIFNKQLKNFPQEILKLNKLEILYLGYNEIKEIPKEISRLKKMRVISFFENKIKILPRDILELNLVLDYQYSGHSPGKIYLLGNPLESPPIEIIEKGNEAVVEYFKSLEGEREALNEVKVLFVGDGGAGKTSLNKRLIGERFREDEEQTYGINLNSWNIALQKRRIKANMWDFGGQKIMHATHQFFLSKRSLYILVLDGRKDEDAEYWLKHIQSFGGNSPILVVLNKIDQNPGFEVNRKHLRDKYLTIKGFIEFPAKPNKD